MLHRTEIDHPAYPVHTATYHFLVIQCAQLLLTEILLGVHQFPHSLHAQLGIVLADDPDIMLNQHLL